MKETESQIINELCPKGDGLRVPEGFFDDFAVKMAGKLPFREELDVPVSEQAAPRNSRWMRIRPYAYMAAMFAGAWCLIKMFTLMSPANTDVNINNYPALSLALEDDQFVDEYVIDGVSSYDILEDSYYYSMESDNDSAADVENTAEQATDDETPTYILPTDGDYSTPPYTNN